MVLVGLTMVSPSRQWPAPFLLPASRTARPSPFVNPRAFRLRRCPLLGSSGCRNDHRPPRSSSTSLFGGYGVAVNYSWREEQYEIDVTVPVPAGTTAGDVVFKATPKSVDLRLSTGGVGGGEVVLLDGSRTVKGRVAVDGTYWALSDPEEEGAGSAGNGPGGRLVTVTIEKMIREPADQFEVVEFDWGGVYLDDGDEVLEKKYDEPEELDVRDYCRELGVDIDNINMSMVDKTMFTSGLNITKSTLDELSEAGYVKEVTQQDFGRDFVTDKDGAAVPFSPLGENVGDDEIQEARYGGDAGAAGEASPSADGGCLRDQLRDLVGGSGGVPAHPWKNSMPAEEARIDDDVAGGIEGAMSGVESATQATPSAPSIGAPNAQDEQQGECKDTSKEDSAMAVDPIDLLTVKRLKEILREQGLKVGGNKQELRDRLRTHVGTMLENSSQEE